MEDKTMYKSDKSRKKTIRKYIDNMVLKTLPEGGYDKARQELNSTCQRYLLNLVEKPESYTIESIDKITDVRSKYLALFIFFARQRVLDLYKIEQRDIKGYSPIKKFKMIIFKEKLEGKYD